ncbi:hypothetical protein NDU88_001123 [Pleurodeles waltl]|uniref:Uncharacterized protein n=1 Tax=Pleurodeles waltl TaxID=8319 RepID=A0AAV7Q649_PLEWA|nr:hypothetical protein NDU88_001123 [Pleurodeles waltl]
MASARAYSLRRSKAGRSEALAHRPNQMAAFQCRRIVKLFRSLVKLTDNCLKYEQKCCCSLWFIRILRIITRVMDLN